MKILFFLSAQSCTALFAVLLLVGCASQGAPLIGHHFIGPLPIAYQTPQGHRKHTVSLVVAGDTANYMYNHTRGTDTWTFQVGQALDAVASEVLQQHYQDVEKTRKLSQVAGLSERDRIVEVRSILFVPKVGLFQWSEHEASVRITCVVYDGALTELWKGELQGTSRASASGEGRAYIPILGNTSYDKALSVAMNQAVLDSLNQVVVKIEGTFDQQSKAPTVQ